MLRAQIRSGVIAALDGLDAAGVVVSPGVVLVSPETAEVRHPVILTRGVAPNNIPVVIAYEDMFGEKYGSIALQVTNSATTINAGRFICSVSLRYKPDVTTLVPLATMPDDLVAQSLIDAFAASLGMARTFAGIAQSRVRSSTSTVAYTYGTQGWFPVT